MCQTVAEQYFPVLNILTISNLGFTKTTNNAKVLENEVTKPKLCLSDDSEWRSEELRREPTETGGVVWPWGGLSSPAERKITCAEKVEVPEIH